MKSKKYYAQPDVPTSIVCWSFTWMIFLFSMLLWLEITVFQIWTLMTLIIFLVVSFIELHGRYLQILDNKINYHALIVFNGQDIDIKKIKSISCNKWGVVRIFTNVTCYSFWLTPKNAKKFTSKVSKLIVY